jgi:hypothetical protein
MDTDQKFRDQLAICKAAKFLFDAFPHASCADLARGIAKYRGGADFKAYRKSGASPGTSPNAEWHQFLALTDWQAPTERKLQRWKKRHQCMVRGTKTTAPRCVNASRPIFGGAVKATEVRDHRSH